MSNRFLTSISLLMIAIFCTTCTKSSTNDANKIYRENRKFLFQTDFYTSDSVLDHSMEIKMIVNEYSFWTSLVFGMQKIDYQYISNDSIIMTEHTLYSEDSTEFSFHPPRRGKMVFTEIVPFPEYRLPFGRTSRSESTMFIPKKWEWWDDLLKFSINPDFSIPQKFAIERKSYQTEQPDTLQLMNAQLVCFRKEGENCNQYDVFGKYYVKHWFNEIYGWVQSLYIKPDGSFVEMRLKEVKD